jgi:hypothetical protein
MLIQYIFSASLQSNAPSYGLNIGQVPSNFDGEFHNVIATPFTLFNDQESNGKP